MSWTHPGKVHGGPGAARECPGGAGGVDAEQAVDIRSCTRVFCKKT